MNNTNNLLEKLKKKNIFVRFKNKDYLKFDSFEPFKINEIYYKNIDKDSILILKSNKILFEYWFEQDLIIPPWHTHWFQLKDNCLIKLKDNLLKKLLNQSLRKAGNLYKLSNHLKLSSPTFYNFYKGKLQMVSIKKLRRILRYLQISYTEFNNKIEYTRKGSKISIKEPKFPIDLNSKFCAQLLGYLVSDGCLYIDEKARGVIRTKYSTSEKESIDDFTNLINKVFGEVYIQSEYVRNCTILRIGSSIIGNSLIKVGAILGHKAKNNQDIPWIIRLGSNELKKNYLKATFTDEASVYLSKRPGSSYVILSRYMHLKNLTAKQKQILIGLEKDMSSRRFPTEHINKSITIKKALEIIKNDKDFSLLLRSIPKLLLGESKILNYFGIKHRLWNRSLNKTSLGNYSVCVDLFINRKSSIEKFYKEIGFLLDSKQKKLKEVIKT